MTQLWADDDELRTFKHLRARGVSTASMAARMGRSTAWVEQMRAVNATLPRASQTAVKVPAPPRVRNNCAKHLQLICQATGGKTFPYGINRQRPAP